MDLVEVKTCLDFVLPLVKDCGNVSDKYFSQIV